MSKTEIKTKKIRFINRGDLTKLMIECGCSTGTIYNALKGVTNSPKSQEIIEKAKNYKYLIID